jgi:hypothetical protein
MKFKTTIILLVVFVTLLAVVLVFESKTKSRKESAAKLVDLEAADVEKITLKKEDVTITLKKDNKGEWLITEPIEAKADSNEVSRLAEDFSSLKFERIVEAEAGDPAKYEIPKKEITLWYKGRPQPIKILIGMENPLDQSLFAKKEDDQRIVLLASSIKTQMDKKVIDFRQKDIFKFEVGDVADIKLKAKDITWEAQKKDGEWHFQTPENALANKSRVENVLMALAGLKAKEFVAEQKQEADITKFGLKEPEYAVTLALPAKNQQVVFSLHKQDETVYVTTSISTKIITSEGQVLSDIEKKTEDLREKQVAVFNSWDAQKVQVKKDGLVLTVSKDKDENWHFEEGAKEAADKSKIETFIRRIESLEAAEFIDSPGNLQDYGLAQPQAEVTIWAKQGETENQSQVLIGTEDAAKKQVVVKNPKLSYLFRVDSSILGDLPKDVKDWKPVPPPQEKKTATPEKETKDQKKE